MALTRVLRVGGRGLGAKSLKFGQLGFKAGQCLSFCDAGWKGVPLWDGTVDKECLKFGGTCPRDMVFILVLSTEFSRGLRYT